jgi:XTP/dITP diphosphohydrolase
MTVILVDPRRPAVVPIDAVELLGGDVQYTEEMPIRVQWSLPAARSALMGPPAPVLLSSNPEHPEVKTRLANGEKVIAAPAGRPGERLVDAVEIMDRLRTSGPWESEQTHDSLRRYLREETYELFDAVHGGNATELRDELGDVLLQVLFHARIAEEAPFNAFGIDDVADALIRKLGNRVPAVLAGEHITLEDQLAQWEQRKATEQNSGHDRRSCVDGVPTAQPALALAQKVIDRATAAGVRSILRRPDRRRWCIGLVLVLFFRCPPVQHGGDNRDNKDGRNHDEGHLSVDFPRAMGQRHLDSDENQNHSETVFEEVEIRQDSR